MSSGVFSPLAHGYGTWTGGLDFPELRELESPAHKAAGFPYLVEPHPPSQIYEQARPDNLPKRPSTSGSPYLLTPREPSPRAASSTPRQQTPKFKGHRCHHRVHTRASLPGSAVYPRRQPETPNTLASKPRAASAANPPTTAWPPGNPPVRPDTGEIAMPKTYVTRRGALVLFSAPADLDLNRLTEQERAYLHHASQLLRDRYADYSSKFGSIQRLAHSVLTFGDQEEPTTETESITDTRHQVWLKFLHEMGNDSDVDMRLQPGGDIDAYLRSLRFKAGSHSRVSTATLPSFRLADIRKDAGEKVEGEMDTSTDSHLLSHRRRKRKKLSADALASSLKSASYLGRPCPTPLTASVDEEAFGVHKLPHSYLFPGVDVSEEGRPAQTSFYSELSSQSLLLNEEGNSSNDSHTSSTTQLKMKRRKNGVVGLDTDVNGLSASASQVFTQDREDDRTAPLDTTETLEEAAEILNTRVQDQGDDLLVDEVNLLDRNMNEEGEEEFEEELVYVREEVEGEISVAQPLMPSYTAGLLSGSGEGGATFSLASTSADNVAEADVKIEDMSHAMLVHGDESLVPRPLTAQGQKEDNAAMDNDKADAMSTAEVHRQRSVSVASSHSGLSEDETKDSAHPDSAHPDSAHPDPTHQDSAHQDSAHPDSAHPDSAHPDSAHPDSAHPDSAHQDSAHQDSAHQDSAHNLPSDMTSQHSVPAERRPSPKLTSTPKVQSRQGSKPPSVAGDAEQNLEDKTTIQDAPGPAPKIRIPSNRSATSSTEKIKITPAAAVPTEPSVSALSSIRGDSVTVTPHESRATSPLPTPKHSRPGSSIPKTEQTVDNIPKKAVTIKEPSVTREKDSANGSPAKTILTEKKPQPAITEEKAKDELKKEKEKKEKTKDTKKATKPTTKSKEKETKGKTYTKAFDITVYEEPAKEPEPAPPPKIAKADIAKILGVPPTPPPQEKKKETPKPRPPPRVRKKSLPPPKTKDELELEKLEKEMSEMFDSKPALEEVVEEGEEEEDLTKVGMTAEELELEAQLLQEKLAAAEEKIQKEPEEKGKKAKKEKAEKPAKKGKKGKKKPTEDQSELEKKKEAIREAKRLEKEKRLAEARQLEAKIKQKEAEKAKVIEEAQRKKRAMDEELEDMMDEARAANEAEEEARAALVAARKLAREEREAKRKADLERKKLEAQQRREEEKARAEAARQRELDMLMRISDAEERRKLAEDERKRKEEEEEKEYDRQQEEEQLAKKRAEEEEERIREAERQAEEEVMARLVEEREEAERRKRRKMEEARKLEEEEEKIRQHLRAEEKRLQEEKKKQEAELKRRQEEEQKRLGELRRMESEAREKLREEMEKRRELLLKRRDHNLERRNHSEALKIRQCIQRPWVWTYYVLWPRDTYEKKIGGEDDKKKKGFRPKPKSKKK